MRLADVFVRLDRAEFPVSEYFTRFANRLPRFQSFGQLHEQGIGELVSAFAMINIRHNHFDRSGLVKLLDKFRRLTWSFEMSEGAGGFSTGVQPCPRLTANLLFQK